MVTQQGFLRVSNRVYQEVFNLFNLAWVEQELDNLRPYYPAFRVGWIQGVRKVESPNQMLERFQSLFLDESGYVEPQVSLALEELVTDERAEQEFKFFLNRITTHN